MPTTSLLQPALTPALRGPFDPSGLTPIQRALSILRRSDLTSHIYVPGANGVSVGGLASNNYLLSDGSTGYSTVDSVDGLMLDGMGSLGSELITNGDFSNGTTGWSATDVQSISSGELVVSGASATKWSYQSAVTVVGKMYQLGGTRRGGTGSAIVWVGTASGTNSLGATSTVTAGNSAENLLFFTATTTTTFIQCLSVGAGLTAYFDNISVREFTGIHATQSTTANKPIVRRGAYNLLLNSATPATQSVTCIAGPYTLALYGTGNVVLSGTGSGTLTGTGAADLVVLNFTPTAGSVTFTKSGTVSSFGLFPGTWTAAQIAAEGGIPTTTATAASNPSAGKYWLSFDGSNDELSASVPFQMSDDHCVTLVARRDSLTNTAALFCIGGATVTPLIALFECTAGTSALQVYWKDDAALQTFLASTIVAGEVAVFTARQVGNVRVLRKNGVQVATSTTVLGTTTVTSMLIGNRQGTARNWPGAIGHVAANKGTFTDADCLIIERYVASQFPGAPSF